MGIVTKTTDKYQRCIDACNACAQACYECFKLCLNEQDVQARKGCISMLVECAMICQTASSLMFLDAQHAMEFCKLCAAVCDKCTNECSMFKDQHCADCANQCRTCAEECRMMAG